MTTNLAIYIHWPFCKAKCPYCDFNSHVKDGLDYDQWNKAYLTEINHFSDYIKGQNITSIFFGGGTPSLMPPYIVANIINKLASLTNFTDDIEITLEGNPTSVEAAKFIDFKQAGINRVSLGVQSLNNNALKFLGREHSADEALQAIETASLFDNYSFDLIYALPDQTLQDWQQELTQALQYANNHMSLYQLTIEKGTKFYGDYKQQKFSMPDDSLSADFYKLTNDIMSAHQLPAYEISNHAKHGYASQHNLTYWRYGDYLGIGAGAHSRITINNNKHAQIMVHNPDKWLELVTNKGVGIQSHTTLNDSEIIEELVMMGLRINEGIDLNNLQQLTLKPYSESLKNTAELINSQFIEIDNGYLKATKKGKLLLNSITKKLLGH